MDGEDKLAPLEGVPQCAPGAPLPHVLAAEGRLDLLYLIENTPTDWDATTIRVVDDESVEPVALVAFEKPEAAFLGPPNDEALAGHPLAGRGLVPYSAFAVEPSSWIRELARRNSYHPEHDPSYFEQLRHFIFTFHDSTFECVASDFTASIREGSVRSILRSLAE